MSVCENLKEFSDICRGVLNVAPYILVVISGLITFVFAILTDLVARRHIPKLPPAGVKNPYGLKKRMMWFELVEDNDEVFNVLGEPEAGEEGKEIRRRIDQTNAWDNVLAVLYSFFVFCLFFLVYRLAAGKGYNMKPVMILGFIISLVMMVGDLFENFHMTRLTKVKDLRELKSCGVLCLQIWARVKWGAISLACFLISAFYFGYFGLTWKASLSALYLLAGVLIFLSISIRSEKKNLEKGMICLIVAWLISWGHAGSSFGYISEPHVVLTNFSKFPQFLVSLSFRKFIELYEESRKLFFNYYPKYIIWVYLVLVQTTVWFLFIMPVLMEINKLRCKFSLSWAKYLWSYLVVWLFMIFLLVLTFFIIYQYLTPPYLSESLLLHHRSKERILIFLGYLVAAFSLSGMIFVNSSISTLQPSSNDAVSRYLTLRASLQKFLIIVGLQIGLATLSNAAQQKAIGNEIIYPIQFVFVIGLFFTLYISIIYFPVFARVQNFGREAVVSKLKAEKFSAEWFKEREDLEKHLGLKVGFRESLETGVPILAPLLGGLVPSLLSL